MKPVTHSSEVVHKNPWYQIRHDKLTWPNGKPGDYFVVEIPDTACIIAKRGDELLVVQQHRHTFDALSIEFPGGGIQNNESPLETAKRELQEETGIIAKKWTRLGTLQVLGGLAKVRLHVFLAEDLSETDKNHDDGEQGLENHWISLDKWHESIRTGSCVDSESLAAWALYLTNKT